MTSQRRSAYDSVKPQPVEADSEVCHVPAWLAHVYFINDPYRPTTREQWNDFLAEVKLEMTGRRDFSHALVTEVFLDAKS